jgi:hypothetical protein
MSRRMISVDIMNNNERMLKFQGMNEVILYVADPWRPEQ